jgi:hypothetical protein
VVKHERGCGTHWPIDFISSEIFAQFRVRGQIDLPPLTLATEVTYLSAEPDGNIGCHPTSIGLFFG